MRDLQASAWFGIVENLAMGLLLSTLYIDWHMHGILPTELEIVSTISHPGTTLTLLSKLISLLEMGVRGDAMVHCLVNLRYFTCLVSLHITVKLGT